MTKRKTFAVHSKSDNVKGEVHQMENRLKQFYRTMLLIRRFEEQAIELYKEGLVGGSYHPYIGQEAVAVGVCSALRQDDYLTNTYRGRGQHIAKGSDPKLLLAEVLGRATGYCKGKGGPMHITDVQNGILGANGIVGGGAPIGVGAALTAKMTGTDRVSVTFFGDGAINQGVVYEAMNLAAIWDLPVVFVCENNLYSEMTPIQFSLKNKDLIDRAEGVRIPGIIVDGNDVEAVFNVTTEAVERARRGEGPTFIEAKTYRLNGHMYGDSETYRSKEEVAAWWEKEPIKRLGAKLVASGEASADELEAINHEVLQEIARAAEFARQSPEPGFEEIFTDVI
ncbi:thiamine pyrophosphate-dependent dehydrogenase E1 component subunit alpha [Paenibacillus sp. EPM92]|uniref:thiamine pyrophosphate-dependent dehydrogenase E1 component subunit alpha n=1 Tax=Paenibacillus sp. EPM92 TaxID=1561195 RepID=UPI00273930F5|nr:thiamine pyrophosphate-dependent dehydrogenase E1 component subunit alpha [Paenibacillus sp. EPM92]